MSSLSDFFGGSSTDPNAIHDNVDAEISAVTEKASPVSGDLLLIEDSAASNAKKRVQIGNLPTGADALADLSDVGSTTATNRNALMADGDSWESRAIVEADISDLGTYLESETSHADVVVDGDFTSDGFLIRSGGAGSYSVDTGTYEPTDSTILREADVDDTPVDGVTDAPVSSNWAYDHEADVTTKHLPDQSGESGNFLTTNGTVASWASGGSGATQLSELSDVGVTTATNRNALLADGDSWESRAIVEADISDLGSYLTTVQLSDLTDVGVTTATNRNALMADGDSWESRAIVEADISDLQSYLTAETSHADVVVDGDFTSDGFLKRSGGAGSYTVDTATYITSSGVTYENLNGNSDVGTGSSQVAAGDHSHATYLLITDIDDTPVDTETSAPISSNWAYDHANGADPHSVYKLESEMGTGATVNIHVGTSAPGSPSTGDLWVDTN